MPPFRFKAFIPYNYAGTRDVKGILLGTVQPGDVRDLDEAPDRWWSGADGNEGRDEPAGDSRESGAPEGDAPEPAPEPSGPTPAPPAVIAVP